MKEIIIDGFAGGGGASLGIEWALGCPVDIAINHDVEAIAMHAANHPDTEHYLEDIWAVNPRRAVGGRPVGLAWFSPDCTHHSRAKGGKPVKKEIRSLAWVVVKWASQVRPRVICLENVPEFQDWGPLKEDNRPDPKRRGTTFNLFVNRLRGYGYRVEWRVLKACDYGAPTSRSRLFLVARCDGRPIVWPAPTHGPAGNKDGLPAYRTAAECIDWSLPCPSIFERKKPLAENTLRRIARGLYKYVIEAKEPFVIGIDHQSSGSGCAYRISEPLRTVTRENRFALITPFLSKYHGQKGNESRCSGLDESVPTLDTSNRFALVAPFIAKHYGGVTGHGVQQPIGTITAIDHHSLVSAFLLKYYGTSIGSDVRQSLPTITGQGQHLAEVRAFLIKYYGCGVGQALNDPLHTVVSKDRCGLVMVHGDPYRIVDIGLRMLTPRELARAQGFPDSYQLTGTKTSQVARIGNSVCPPMAEALVRANVTLDEMEAVAL